MSAVKHTMGRWRVFGARAENGTSNEIRTYEKLIARVFMNGNPLEREANARLIAAAPDLLEVAELVLASASIEMSPLLFEAARAAVARTKSPIPSQGTDK